MAVLLGPKNRTGPQGEQGPIGERGLQGPTGKQGPIGLDGIPGVNGKDGATWFSGPTVPSPSLGKVNDFYLRNTTGDIYKKTTTGWKLELNIVGRSVTSSQTVVSKRFKRGEIKIMYNEELLLSPETKDILTFTPPPTKAADVLHLVVNGDNLATYKVYINDVIIERKHTWWTKFHDKIEMEGYTLRDTDTLRVEAINFRPEAGYFNATIYVDQYSVI